MPLSIHPKTILGDEMRELNISALQLADIIGVPHNHLYQIIAGKRELTTDTALRLSRYFSTSLEFWMNLQDIYELDVARQKLGKDLNAIPRRALRYPRIEARKEFPMSEAFAC